DQGADASRGVLVRTLGLVAFKRRGRRQGHAVLVVDDLSVDVLRRAEDRQARTAASQRTQAATVALGATLVDFTRRERHGLLLLAFLATHLLAGVTHALALIGLRRTDAADAGGDLTDRLLVDPGDLDLGLLRRGEGDAGRRSDVHVVAEAELHGERLAL